MIASIEAPDPSPMTTAFMRSPRTKMTLTGLI
jgi:hypothetical protein